MTLKSYRVWFELSLHAGHIDEYPEVIKASDHNKARDKALKYFKKRYRNVNPHNINLREITK